jgi:hypothetical protein
VIVWLNGCFGAGKTTTAQLLRDALGGYLFDPEPIGFLLWDVVPDLTEEDFRGFRPWQRLVVEGITALWEERQRPIVVPMSVFDRAHQDGTIGALRRAGLDVRHVVLSVDEAELRRRIEEQVMFPDDPPRDAGVRDFRLEQLPLGLAMHRDPEAAVVDVADRTPEAVGREVVARLV